MKSIVTTMGSMMLLMVCMNAAAQEGNASSHSKEEGNRNVMLNAASQWHA